LNRSSWRRLPVWALVVFAVAIAARVGFWLLVDQPLLFTHQYHYFTNGLTIAAHPDPWSYLLRSDDWRLWNGWTIAPLYYPFEALVFRIFGTHLEPLRLVQCVMGALTAAAVGAIGRAAIGPRGYWAGLLYAVHGYSVELPTWTLTENLHNVLYTFAVALLLRSVHAPGVVWTAAGAALFGLSALARSVSSAFLPLAALWRWTYGRRWRPAAALLLAGLAAILPWTARNVFLMGNLIPIEDTAYENLWFANHFTDQTHWRRQLDLIESQPTPAGRRALATHFALRGMRRSPRAFAEKVRKNFWHFLRPEGLHHLFGVPTSQERWRPAFYILLDDLPTLLLLPPFLAFAFGGRRTAAWAFIVAWTAYYVFFEAVVFLNEVPRHRTGFIPLFLVGGVAGVALLAGPDARRRAAPRAGFGLGLLIVSMLVQPYLLPAWRWITSLREMRAVERAIDRGEIAGTEARTAAVAAADPPRASRPWLRYARRLAWAGHAGEALSAYERGDLYPGDDWRPAIARPALLRACGRTAEAESALRTLHALSWNTDPWLLLELAWRELPPPRTDEIALGEYDYGAVRGFFHPRGLDPALSRHRREWMRYEDVEGARPPPGPHRWTRHRAWLRLVPTRPAAAYDITLWMGSPFPSLLTAPEVNVRVNNGEPRRFALRDSIAAYTLRAAAPAGEPLLIRIDAPTWCRPGEPADQGVRVDRLAVVPATTP
jgi:hypothetical protein